MQFYYKRVCIYVDEVKSHVMNLFSIKDARVKVKLEQLKDIILKVVSMHV